MQDTGLKLFGCPVIESDILTRDELGQHLVIMAREAAKSAEPLSGVYVETWNAGFAGVALRVTTEPK